MRKGFLILLSFILFFGCASKETIRPDNTNSTPVSEVELIISYSEAPSVTPMATDAPATVAPTDAPTDTPVPTDTPEPTQPPKPYVAEDGVYTIAWISDPQHYSAKFPELYDSMTLFLRDHREELQLAYIMHTGDLVNKTSDDAQWKVASKAQSYIDEIPNGVLAGNHDCQDPDGFQPYSRYFGESRYTDREWYGGSYKDNRGHYDLLTIGNTDYLFVYMSYGPDSGCIKWLNKVFAEYPDRIGFLLLHDYFEQDLQRSKAGKKLYQQVVLNHPNIYFVLCGHRYGAYRQSEQIDDDQDGTPDHTLYEMMFNYQAAGKVGGDGYLRLLQVNEKEGTMHMLTYSPNLDDFNRFDDPANREKRYELDETAEEFLIPIPWL